MFTLFSTLSGLSMDLLNPNQSLPSPSFNSKKKECNKVRRDRNTNSRKKHQKGKKKPNKIPTTFKPKCTKVWKWKTLKSSFLTTQEKRLLFKVHNLIALKEQNSALIYKLQCNIYTQYYKDHNSVMSTSTKSSSLQPTKALITLTFPIQ